MQNNLRDLTILKTWFFMLDVLKLIVCCWNGSLPMGLYDSFDMREFGRCLAVRMLPGSGRIQRLVRLRILYTLRASLQVSD